MSQSRTVPARSGAADDRVVAEQGRRAPARRPRGCPRCPGRSAGRDWRCARSASASADLGPRPVTVTRNQTRPVVVPASMENGLAARSLRATAQVLSGANVDAVARGRRASPGERTAVAAAARRRPAGTSCRPAPPSGAVMTMGGRGAAERRRRGPVARTPPAAARRGREDSADRTRARPGHRGRDPYSRIDRGDGHVVLLVELGDSATLGLDVLRVLAPRRTASSSVKKATVMPSRVTGSRTLVHLDEARLLAHELAPSVRPCRGTRRRGRRPARREDHGDGHDGTSPTRRAPSAAPASWRRPPGCWHRR